MPWLAFTLYFNFDMKVMREHNTHNFFLNLAIIEAQQVDKNCSQDILVERSFDSIQS